MTTKYKNILKYNTAPRTGHGPYQKHTDEYTQMFDAVLAATNLGLPVYYFEKKDEYGSQIHVDAEIDYGKK